MKSCKILQYPRESWNPNQLWKRSFSIIDKIIWNSQAPREALKIVPDPKQDRMESTTILEEML